MIKITAHTAAQAMPYDVRVLSRGFIVALASLDCVMGPAARADCTTAAIRGTGPAWLCGVYRVRFATSGRQRVSQSAVCGYRELR